MHLGGRDAIILHCKSDILANRQPNELTVRILQHRANDLGELEDIQVPGFLPLYLQTSLNISLVIKRDQAIQAMTEGAFPASAGSHNENLLPGIDLEVDIHQGRFCLGKILEGKMIKLDDGGFGHGMKEHLSKQGDADLHQV